MGADFSKVKQIGLGYHGVNHYRIKSSQCQKNQFCDKSKCHYYHKPTPPTTTTAKPTPDEPSLATLLQLGLQLLTKLEQNQQKHHKQLIEKQEQLHQLLRGELQLQFGAQN